MKRFFQLFCAVSLVLVLCSLQFSALAATDPNALTISNITVTRSGDDLILNTTMHNSGSTSIDEFGIALAFLDADGYQVYAYAATQEGYSDEICNWYYEPDSAILSGSDYKTEDIFTGYTAASTIAVAIRYYHKENSDYILLPESEWQWQFPGYITDVSSTSRTYYTDPPSAVYTAIEDYYLGYSYYLLDDYNADYYGKNQGGEWITSVYEDSPALDAGLMAGDLVLFADGLKPTENLYAVEYAILNIVNGEKVEWVFERDGLINTTRFTTP